MRLKFAKLVFALSNQLTRLCYRGGDNIPRGKWYCHRRGRTHPLTTRFDLLKTIDRDLAVFSCGHPRVVRIREPQSRATVVGNLIDDNDGHREGFLAGVRETILIFARIVVVSSVIATLVAAYLITRLTHANQFPLILCKGIEFLGPVFIKFGQWISTRRDIFSREVCNAMSRLQRHATPHSWLHTKRVLNSTYGPSWRKLFVRFDGESPIGSGCCAQVYKAWIDLSAMDAATSSFQDSGLDKTPDESIEFTFPDPRARRLRAVAVKVLHPGITDQLKRDIAIMRGISKCATYFIPELHWLSLADCIDEFARIMENQIDMRTEAVNLGRFSTNFSRRRDIVFPHPYTHLTRREILVESFHEGSPISDYLEHNDVALQRKLAKIGIATILKMVFRDNLIHCDLHPGNILVEKAAVLRKPGLFNTFRRVITPDYVADDPRLIILDCGLVASLNDRCRQNLRNVFHSVLMGNGELAAQHILEHSSCTTSDSDGFKRSMRNILSAQRNSLNVNVSTVLTELFSAMVRHRVKQDGAFSNVILSMLVIEGLGRCLDPNIDIFTEILPYIVSNDCAQRLKSKIRIL
ncbi:uncharacterized aarF domain-containing protein kinase 2-like isoform X2 [Pseudomyrmex gracilis]|uniref:uncharacterized aarF domain-containing protein kinase 2-like isoform X2 n=1 Tax=Pseudomyrmex gracilis TaxID=219809 RepID=UPI0009949F54|nr:uncharacterized aarF domain-containing protein kinase 2-like isoform X2 [Pseudomyrmex gracilis]